jgi:hypothetical protein
MQILVILYYLRNIDKQMSVHSTDGIFLNIFYPQLVESVQVEPINTKGHLYSVSVKDFIF